MTPDLKWLRAHSPIFALMQDKTIEVKKSEQEYRDFKTKNTVDKRENTTL